MITRKHAALAVLGCTLLFYVTGWGYVHHIPARVTGWIGTLSIPLQFVVWPWFVVFAGVYMVTVITAATYGFLPSVVAMLYCEKGDQ